MLSSTLIFLHSFSPSPQQEKTAVHLQHKEESSLMSGLLSTSAQALLSYMYLGGYFYPQPLLHTCSSVGHAHINFLFFFNFFFNVYLFLGQRETEHERGRGRERGRHRIGNRLQTLSRQPRARCGARTHGPQDRDLAEVGRLTDCATQAPLTSTFYPNLGRLENGSPPN